MKEDVIVANIDNLRQSINELKEYIEKKNVTILKPGNISGNSGQETYLATAAQHIAVFTMVPETH